MGIGVTQTSNTLYDVGASIMNIHKSYYVELETKIKFEGLLYNMSCFSASQSKTYGGHHHTRQINKQQQKPNK